MQNRSDFNLLDGGENKTWTVFDLIQNHILL